MAPGVSQGVPRVDSLAMKDGFMQYIHTDLGHRQRGDRIEFTLRGNAANVMLLGSSNFSNYKSGRNYRYIGGQTTRSPVVLQVPRAGRWHAVVDLRGLGGRVNASVRVLPNALPPIRQTTSPPLRTIGHNIATWQGDAEAGQAERTFDVFISHATEDKDGIVRALAHELAKMDLKVWYDEFELRVGDSLRRKIDYGLSRSRFGVVVLSRSFFAKNWPQYELDGLVTREMSGGGQVILPVWHDITKDEVIAYSPSLADKVALRTADSTVDEIAHEIADVVRGI